eukprot:1156723-Pelagomonas_calceolata.AAC.9
MAPTLRLCVVGPTPAANSGTAGTAFAVEGHRLPTRSIAHSGVAESMELDKDASIGGTGAAMKS